MASNPKNQDAIIKRLAPNAIRGKVDGHDLIVPATKEENIIFSMILAAQMRTLVQEHIKKYKDGEVQLTPKELKDLSEAARNAAAFAADVYNVAEPINKNEKIAEKADAEIVDFSKLSTQKENKDNAPEADESRPDTGDKPEGQET